MDNNLVNKEKRSKIRIPLLVEACYWTSTTVTGESCSITDITSDGVFIKSSKFPVIGEDIRVKFVLPKDLGILELTGTVKWKRWTLKKGSTESLGFGIKFTFDVPSHKAIMEAYCTYLKNKQIIQVTKRLMEEFFNRRNPVI